MKTMISEMIKYAFFITLCTAIVSAAGMTCYLKDRGTIKCKTGFNFIEIIIKYIEISQNEKGKIGNWFWATVLSFILAMVFAVLMIFTIFT